MSQKTKQKKKFSFFLNQKNFLLSQKKKKKKKFCRKKIFLFNLKKKKKKKMIESKKNINLLVIVSRIETTG